MLPDRSRLPDAAPWSNHVPIAMNHLLAGVLSCSLLLAPALADEIVLKDGRVLVGKVVQQGNVLEITTRDGVVRVDEKEVAERRDEQKLREALAELRKASSDTPFAHLQLAMQAYAYDLDRELWEHLDRAVEVPADQEHAPLQKRVDDFLAQLEPEILPRKLRRADTHLRVRELLLQLRGKIGPGKRAAILELLVREPNADKDLRTEARRNSDDDRRLLAVEALVRRGTAGNDRFAWRTSILDRDQKVREGAMAIAVRQGATDGAVDYLTPGLMHDSAEVRVRTAEAFGALGDAAAIKPLVIAGPNAGKALASADNGVRAHVAFLQQQAYIRDFDVEVASASFIADPKIGVLQSGTVLDVTVHGVTQEQVRIVRAYRSALGRLAGSDPGARPTDWATWLQRLRERQAAPVTQPGKN